MDTDYALRMDPSEHYEALRMDTDYALRMDPSEHYEALRMEWTPIKL